MILAVDPSIRHVGWATKAVNSVRYPIWQHGTIHVPQGKTLPQTLGYIARRLSERACSTPTTLIVEYPEFHGGEKGATAAVQGTTFGLAAVAGYLQAFFEMQSKDTFFYTPSQWKGQVPKKGMEYRFEKLMGYTPKTDHEAEALLMIQYHLTNL